MLSRTQVFYLFVLVVLGSLALPSGPHGPFRPTFEPDQTRGIWMGFRSSGRLQADMPGAAASPTALWEESPARQRVRAGASRLAYVDPSGRRVTSEQIRSYLESQGSPMADFAENIVGAGNRYGVDPKLIVAIAGVESTFGRNAISYNAWGWNNGRTRWRSWTQAIDQYTRAFAEKYPNHTNIRRMAPRYNPNTPEDWGRKVLLFMASIDRPSSGPGTAS